MSLTIKAAVITAVATIIAAIIMTNKDPFNQTTTNVNGTQSPVIQNSQHVTVTYSNKGKVNSNSNQSHKVRPEDNLNKIFIGANERFLESIFGVPVVENKLPSIHSKEVFYSFKRFYLQFLYSMDGRLFFYAVTSKDVNFMPKIPALGLSLGLTTFKEAAQEATHLYSYLTSKHYGYGEYVYLGNMGNYHNYYLGYNSAGVNYEEWDNVVTYVEAFNDKNLEKFRSTMKPNSFGIGDMVGVDNDNLLYEVGVEFYTFRNEPLILTRNSRGTSASPLPLN